MNHDKIINMGELNLEESRGYRERAGKKGKSRRDILGIGARLISALSDKPKHTEKSSQQTKFTRGKFLRGMGTAAGLLGLAAATGRDTFVSENRADEAINYQTRLAELDAKIIDIESFEEVAGQIGDLAVKYFFKEMDYDLDRYNGRLYFVRNSDYEKKKQEITGCIETDTAEDEYAFTGVSSQDMVFNLSSHLVYTDSKLISANHAQQLFSDVLHELHHAAPPVLQEIDTPAPEKWRGLTFLEPKLEKSQANNVCYRVERGPLEEAIVTDSTNFMLERLGLTNMVGKPAEDYRMWVKRYREGIVDKLFGGDHKPLLRLHQQTRQNAFFSLIGEKLRAPSNQRAEAGEEYVHRVLLVKTP